MEWAWSAYTLEIGKQRGRQGKLAAQAEAAPGAVAAAGRAKKGLAQSHHVALRQQHFF